MGTVQVEGAGLECVEEGRSGEPVVFVHGDLSDRRTWAAQMPVFAERYRTIAYSRRYHYPNEPIPDGADNPMGPHVRDLAALLRRFDAAPAHLVGDSWGGFVCLRLAIQEPELVRSLVLAEPPVVPLFRVSTPPKPHEVIRLLLTHPRDGMALVRFATTAIGPASAAFRRGDMDGGAEIFARAVLTDEVYENLPEARREQARQNATATAAALATGFGTLAADDVATVQIPTLVVTGDRSPAIFLRLADRVEKLLPNVRRVTVPNASHSPHEQNPEFYNKAVLDFLSAAPAR